MWDGRFGGYDIVPGCLGAGSEPRSNQRFPKHMSTLMAAGTFFGASTRVGVALLLGVLAGACEGEPEAAQSAAAPPPPMVTAAKPVVRQIVEDDEFVGRFEARAWVDVRARVGGYLETLEFAEGGLVKKGDLLFKIDKRPFETALAEANAQLRIARTQQDFASTQLKRAERLAKRGNIATSVLDERRQNFLSARASVAGATAQVARAQLDLEYAEIRAPISGRIDRYRIYAGNLVSADDTILTTIASVDPIDFFFDVDERSFLAYARQARERGAVVQEGAGALRVRASIADRDQPPFLGQLNFAENRLDPGSGTIRMRARFPNPDGILQPGLFGRINVPASLPYQGVLISDEAVLADQNRHIVYVVGADGVVQPKIVRPGPRLYGYRVIREGLTGDETIVINGLNRVRPGVRVNAEIVELPPERLDN